MRFLIDNALPPQFAMLLVREGHDAVHVRDYGMHAAADGLILARALEEDRIVVSADTDFGQLLAVSNFAKPSFILFRDPNMLLAPDYLDALLAALPILARDLAIGCVATLRNGRIRVRRLPLLSLSE